MQQNTTDKKEKQNIKDMSMTAKLVMGGIALAVIPGAFVAYLAFAGFNKAYEVLMNDDKDKNEEQKNNSKK